ncbi:hypothetical protein [Nocardioides rubriscoriae]|uniref:hypothetical protein n=1 Tax=Nocardioides rubriscoriae TaxID=642762 RepID=UPI0011E0278F|nr:hypothetical protein [Nocardioides rubriscoriae]
MTDQQWPPYDPGGSEEEAAGDEVSPWGREPTLAPHGAVPYGPPTADEPSSATSPPRTGRRTGPTLAGAVAVAAVVGVAAIFVETDRGGSDTAGTSVEVPAVVVPDLDLPDYAPSPGAPPEVLSPGGYADLVAAVGRRTGGTQVFEAVLYPAYAVVTVPVDATSARSSSLYWDGAFDDFGPSSTASSERVDLAEVDPAVLGRLVRRAEKLVEDPTTTYVIVRGRSTVFDDDGARVLAYATNQFNETGYLAARLDGTVVRRVVP